MDQKTYDEVVHLLENLLHPEAFGWAVTTEVHREARRLLGIIEHEREDVRELS